MIPSRGLRWSAQNIGVGRRRIELLSTRSFSSTLTPNGSSKSVSLASRAGRWGLRSPLRLELLRTASQMRNGASLRFQSSSSVLPAATDTITTDIDHTRWAHESGDFGSIDKAIDLTSLDINQVPEHIGYLKEMGLAYGYGPTSMMEWIIEHVHILAGTPWWASIALTALLVRIVCFYPNVLGAENASKMAASQHLTKPLMEKMRESSRLGDTAETMRIRAELQMINKKAGVKYSLMAIPFIQAPIGFGTFFLLRAMSSLPVPGMNSGGLLWFSNLTIPDPFFILPFLTSFTLHMLLRKGGETGVQAVSADFMRGMSYFLPGISLIFTIFLPASVQLSFLVTGVLSYFQARLFRWAPFRTYMNMTPTDTYGPNAPIGGASPYQSRIITTTSRPSPIAGSATYEPARSSPAPAGPEAPKPTLFSGLKRDVSSGITSVQETARKTIKSAREIAGQESKDGKRTKRQLQQANEFEKKRRLQESKKREEADLARRARREAKRY